MMGTSTSKVERLRAELRTAEAMEVEQRNKRLRKSLPGDAKLCIGRSGYAAQATCPGCGTEHDVAPGTIALGVRTMTDYTDPVTKSQWQKPGCDLTKAVCATCEAAVGDELREALHKIRILAASTRQHLRDRATAAIRSQHVGAGTAGGPGVGSLSV